MIANFETLDDIENLVFLCDRLRSRLTQVSSFVDQLQQSWIDRRQALASDAQLSPLLARKVTKCNEILLNVAEKLATVEIQTESLHNLQQSIGKPAVAPPPPPPQRAKPAGLSQRLNSLSNAKVRIQMQVVPAGTTWSQAEIPIVDHPTAFFVTNQDPRVAQQFQLMSLEMNNHYNKFIKTLTPLQNLSIGDFCAARFSDDGLWYRARVVMNKSKLDEPLFADYSLSPLANSIHIVFIDYGNSEEKPAEEIFPLTESFARLPAMAVACTLSNSFPRNEIFWSPEATNAFRSLVKDRLVEVHFEQQLAEQWPLHFVKVTLDGQSVSQHAQLASYLIPAQNEQIAAHFNDKLTSVEFILYNIALNDADIFTKNLV